MTKAGLVSTKAGFAGMNEKYFALVLMQNHQFGCLS